MKDLALNIIEEVGEFWHLVKWIDEDAQRKVIAERKDEAADFVGDTLFLILKLANRMRIDASKALQDTLNEYEKRMPPDVMQRLGHANTHAGGHDQKELILLEETGTHPLLRHAFSPHTRVRVRRPSSQGKDSLKSLSRKKKRG